MGYQGLGQIMVLTGPEGVGEGGGGGYIRTVEVPP